MMPTHPPYYPPFGSSLPNRTWNDGNRGYRFGFNGKEKDTETASDNFDFGARIYDGRLGRWLSLDVVYNPTQSNYMALKNSSISIVDPTGETDFYNMSGEWIGTDGIDNNIQQVINDKAIVKKIVKNSYKGELYTENIPNGTFYQLPQKIITTAIIQTFDVSQTDVINKDDNTKIDKEGGYFEAGTTFDIEGKQTPINTGNSVGPTDLAAHVTLPESGSVSIHTHPTCYFDLITGYRKSYDAESSLGEDNDQGLFRGFGLNIIVGYDVKSQLEQQILPGGEVRYVDNVRTLIVNFYDSTNKMLFTITYEALNKISEGNTGKTKEKYDKKKADK
jgi:RHS repeat-associated protein